MRIPFTNIEIRTRPTSPPAPDADYWYESDKYSSATGMDVSEEVALRLSTVWACVKVISEDLSSLPLFVYRRDGRNKDRAEDHGLYYLLHDAPNPEMSAMQFREALQSHLLLWGNAYAEISRDMRGQPVALWPLNPARMTVKRPENNVVYEYSLEKTGQPVVFQKEDIFHVAGLGFNGLIGYSPVSMEREAIAIGLSAQDWQGSSFKNGGRLQLAFIHPAAKAPNADARKTFREELRREYGGQSGHSIGVLWEGMKAEKLSMSMEDAQFIESRKFNRTEICAIYRVPPHKVMDLERATFSNIEHQALEYVTDAIRPWAVRWEQAINQQLLNGSGKFFVEHSMEGLLRGDIASRYAAYAVGRQWGWLSPNDVRRLENMNEIQNGDGYMQPMNMTELGAEPVEPKPEPTPEEIEVAREMHRKLELIRRAK